MSETSTARRGSSPAPAGRTVLETADLGFTVGGVEIVKNVSLTVSEREFLAVSGPNGAGKTTLFNLLTGLLRPTTGTITLGGQDVSRTTTAQRARAGLARSFQVTSLFNNLTVLENVRLAAQAHLGGSANLWSRIRRNDPAVAIARRVLDRVGLADRA